MTAPDAVLTRPIDPMLAAPTTALPLPGAVPGGAWYEPKFDGYRALVFVDEQGAHVQSRRGADLTAAFSEIAVAATDQLPAGTVIDGELLIWVDGRPDFSALQRRLARRSSAGDPAGTQAANLLVFDLLAASGQDLMGHTLAERRAALEQLSATMTPPLQVVPGTDDIGLARQWLEDYGRVDVGIEGLVVKGLATTYQPGRRGWLKYRVRDTAEAIVGAVTGTPRSPERLILGAYDTDGELRIVGTTGPLARRQRDELARRLVTAREHPWPTEITAGHWGADRVAIHRVDPSVVVEVSADRSQDNGRWRHIVRLVRIRPELDPREVLPPA